MNARQTSMIIPMALLMLSACSEQSEQKTEEKLAMPAAEQAAPIAMEQSAPVEQHSATDNAEPAPAMMMEKPVAAMAAANPLKAGAALSHGEGLELAKKNGCLSCHKIEGKLVGPAWSDVSARYKGDAGAKKRLIATVKGGGKGNWTAVTGGVPMPPNSPKVLDADIEKLVAFILSL